MGGMQPGGSAPPLWWSAGHPVPVHVAAPDAPFGARSPEQWPPPPAPALVCLAMGRENSKRALFEWWCIKRKLFSRLFPAYPTPILLEKSFFYGNFPGGALQKSSFRVSGVLTPLHWLPSPGAGPGTSTGPAHGGRTVQPAAHAPDRPPKLSRPISEMCRRDVGRQDWVSSGGSSTLS